MVTNASLFHFFLLWLLVSLQTCDFYIFSDLEFISFFVHGGQLSQGLGSPAHCSLAGQAARQDDRQTVPAEALSLEALVNDLD